jgi:antiviral helicase SKI2
MDDLAPALQRLRLADLSSGGIDAVLDQQRPRKRSRRSPDQIRSSLEKDFLAPSTSFSTPWLDRLQQRWDCPTNHEELFELAPTQTRTIIRFTREGLEGRVTGYKEVTVPANSATAKNSTSILRKPANRADFVRGAAGFFPFAPGGLDAVEATAAAEDQLLAGSQKNGAVKQRSLDKVINFGPDGALLELPPGFSRGLDLQKKTPADQDVAKEIENVLEEEPEDLAAGNGDADDVKPVDEADDDDDEEELDALLPVEFPALAAKGQLGLSSNKRSGHQWAHMVDVNRPMPNFRDLVPEMAREWPFEPDTFQKEAIYHLENGDSVFVAAHTSAGKTVVAEYAIALAAKHMTKAIYTSPIKALSNQKFRDFRNEFDDVGILTGDVQIRPEASCLIMTTEILRSMLYRGADIIRDVEFVIFDEVHYVNDLERGVVWEEVIIMLPEHVTLIMLSATVPNTFEFASWVGRTKKKNIYVISTPKRPVPLEHYLWAGKDMFKIVNAEKQFIEKGWKDANDVLSGKDKIKAAEEKQEAAAAAAKSSGAPRGGGRGQPQRGGQQRGGAQRGGAQRGGAQRGRGAPAQRGQGNIARTGRGGGRTTAAQDRTIWVQLIQHLRKEELLPACIFVFSKKRCEENADALSNLDFCTATEKSAIHMILEKSLARLKTDDRQLPQIRRLRELLARGIAVHHGGLLPIVKECVEILFAKTLVKVLFATETFAMGLNLPTRTVVFSGYRKHDGRQFRDLLPGEYTQMAGRAGRRGLDTVGSVIIVAPGADEAPAAGSLRQMMLGDPTKLRSQFRLTYNMILNLLRVEALKIEEMIKRSFSENATQALLPEHEQKVKLSEADLAKIKRESCDICDQDLEACHKAAMRYQELTANLHIALLGSPVGRRMLQPKRLVIYKRDGIRTVGVLLREGVTKGIAPSLSVMEVVPIKSKRQDADLLPCLARYREKFIPQPTSEEQMGLRLAMVPYSELECLTGTTLQFDVTGAQSKLPEAMDQVKQQLLEACSSWTSATWDEVDYSRIKEMNIRNILDERSKAASDAQEDRVSVECENLAKHFAMMHDEWLITENISQLRALMSDQNLQLLPDYEQRIAVLKDLGFVDENSRVELKGKVACEIHSADELVLTELILENVLADYEPEEIVALLSAFVFQEKTDSVPTMTPALERGQATIVKISEKVNHYQTVHQVILSADDSNDFVSRPRFGLTEVVYEWARGMSFNRITDLTDVLEGTIVRVITRLDETCREVKNAARIIGDPNLFTKMQACQEMIKRDICATASLYM